MARERFWTLANAVSMSRVGLAAVFVAVPDLTWRLTVVIVAACTDAADGWIARRRGGGSRWGALIDPVADRAFAILAVGALAWDGTLSSVGVATFLFRDLMTAVGLSVARHLPSLHGLTFIARLSGKLVTVLQFIALVVALVRPAQLPPVLLLLGAASLVSVADYTAFLVRARRNAPP